MQQPMSTRHHWTRGSSVVMARRAKRNAMGHKHEMIAGTITKLGTKYIHVEDSRGNVRTFSYQNHLCQERDGMIETFRIFGQESDYWAHLEARNMEHHIKRKMETLALSNNPTLAKAILQALASANEMPPGYFPLDIPPSATVRRI